MTKNNYAVLAAFYDRLQEADYAQIGEYYHRLIKENCQSETNGGKLLLDLACGTGRLSRYLAGLQYDVIAVDISHEMLSEAVKKPQTNIQYLCQDMTRLDLYGTIDCCVCALDGINHLRDMKQVAKAFSRVSLFMNKGGVFAFDVNTLHKHKEILSGNTFVYDLQDSDNDNLYCVWRNSDCESDGGINMTLDIFEQVEPNVNSWIKYTESITEKAYSLEAITAELERLGFGNIKVYDWLSSEPATELSEKAVFVAVKL